MQLKCFQSHVLVVCVCGGVQLILSIDLVYPSTDYNNKLILLIFFSSRALNSRPTHPARFQGLTGGRLPNEEKTENTERPIEKLGPGGQGSLMEKPQRPRSSEYVYSAGGQGDWTIACT